MNCGWWLLLLLEQWLYSNQAFYTNFLCWKYQMFLGFYGTPAQFTLVESLLEQLSILKDHISWLFLYLYLVELLYGFLIVHFWQQNWLLTSKSIHSLICIVYQKQIGGRFQTCINNDFSPVTISLPTYLLSYIIFLQINCWQ